MGTNTKEKIELVYDDQCPVCKTYCRNIQVEDDVYVTLVDARKQSEIMDEITARGLDIDQGMVVKKGGEIFYGSEAMHQIAMLSDKKGWLAPFNKIFFSTAKRSKIFYGAGKAFRNALLAILGIEYIHNLKSDNTLKHQLGASWKELHPNIQERFDREPTLGEVITYTGNMTDIRRSGMGWLFATLTRVIGNPLSPYAGKDVPMDVELYKKEGRSGVYWKRTYFYEGKAPFAVTSVKRESREGDMLECVGGGFGMKLNVYVENQELHFRSYRYFCSVLNQKIPLPHWISPGEAHVVHKDLGEGDFEFTITMHHPVLGETFYQQGVFRLKD
ncbi:MAG: DUF4166 domain-containing protein [Alcanivorax sp.]